MVTNVGEQIPDASIIVRFGRGAPGGQGVAGSNPVSPTIGFSIIAPCQSTLHPAADSPSITLSIGDFGPDWAHHCEYAAPTPSIAWWSGCEYRLVTAGSWWPATRCNRSNSTPASAIHIAAAHRRRYTHDDRHQARARIEA
jgi:hypothetical protein